MCPKEVSAAQIQTRYSKLFVPRVLFITAVVWMVVCFGLYFVSPHNSGLNFIRIFIVGLAAAIAIVIIVYFLMILEKRFYRTKYKITKERVLIIDGGRRDIKWKNITGYKICDSEELEGFSGVYLFYDKGKFRRLIGLPQDELGVQIVKYIAERVPLLEKTPEVLEIIKLSVWKKIWLCIITGLYSLCISAFFAFYGHKLILLIWTAPFLGPGTIYLASIYGRRFLSNKSIQRYAFEFNLVSVILITLLTFWLMIWQMKKEYGW